MLTSIPAVRDELKARLAEALPDHWEIVKDLTAANVSLVPAVYIEFTEINTEANGAPLGAGTVAASVDLVLVDPRTADAEAEGAIEDEIVPLIQELDTHADLNWSIARKFRQDAGPLSWRLSLIALVTI